MAELFRPSGGVLYHWRAARRRLLWRSFAEAIAIWLESWSIPKDEILLIGPSGGYSLPDPWLNSFARVQAFDLDPLAPWLFRRRHPRTRVSFHKQDMFWHEGRLSTRAIERLLHANPKASVSFCNVLGQIPLEGPITDREWEAFLDQLRGCLEGRRWSSCHDLYTVEPLALSEHGEVAQAADIAQALRLIPADRYEIIDHRLQGRWSDGLEKKRFAWSFTAKSLHIIEGVRPLL